MASYNGSTHQETAGGTHAPPVIDNFPTQAPLSWSPWQQQSLQPQEMAYSIPQRVQSPINVQAHNAHIHGIDSYFTAPNPQHSYSWQGSFPDQLMGAPPRSQCQPSYSNCRPRMRALYANRHMTSPYGSPHYHMTQVPYSPFNRVPTPFRPRKAYKPRLPRQSSSDGHFGGVQKTSPIYGSTNQHYKPPLAHTMANQSGGSSIVHMTNTFSPISSSIQSSEIVHSASSSSGGVVFSNTHIDPYHRYECEFRDRPITKRYFDEVFTRAKVDIASYLDFSPPETVQEAVKSYIDYLLFENEQRIMPMEHSDEYNGPPVLWSQLSREPYFNEMMRLPTVLPTKKFDGWLRLFGMTALRNGVTEQIELIPVSTTSTPKKSSEPERSKRTWRAITPHVDPNGNDVNDILKSSVRAAGLDVYTPGQSPIQGSPIGSQLGEDGAQTPSQAHLKSKQVQPFSNLPQLSALPKITVVKQDQSAETTAAFVETLARLAKHQQDELLVGEPQADDIPQNVGMPHNIYGQRSATITSDQQQLIDDVISAEGMRLPCAPADYDTSYTFVPRNEAVPFSEPHISATANQVSIPSQNEVAVIPVSTQGCSISQLPPPEPDSTTTTTQPVVRLPPISTLANRNAAVAYDSVSSTSDSESEACDIVATEQVGNTIELQPIEMEQNSTDIVGEEVEPNRACIVQENYPDIDLTNIAISSSLDVSQPDEICSKEAQTVEENCVESAPGQLENNTNEETKLENRYPETEPNGNVEDDCPIVLVEEDVTASATNNTEDNSDLSNLETQGVSLDINRNNQDQPDLNEEATDPAQNPDTDQDSEKMHDAEVASVFEKSWKKNEITCESSNTQYVRMTRAKRHLLAEFSPKKKQKFTK